MTDAQHTAAGRQTRTWGEFAATEPDFARRVRERLQIRKHCTMATLRRDGAPRISGTELSFDDGDLRIGSMPGSLKGRDLMRDPRLALHGPTEDPADDDPGSWSGEAKIAGVAVQVPADDGAQGADWFRVELTEVVFTGLGSPADHLVIETWNPAQGLRRIERREPGTADGGDPDAV